MYCVLNIVTVMLNVLCKSTATASQTLSYCWGSCLLQHEVNFPLILPKQTKKKLLGISCNLLLIPLSSSLFWKMALHFLCCDFACGCGFGDFFWELLAIGDQQQRQLADCSYGYQQADGAKSMSVFLALFQLHLPSAQRTFVFSVTLRILVWQNKS